jgi:hypothetical protein
MNGQDLSDEDLSDAGWHGISSAIPAIDDARADCSMPFIVAAYSGDTPRPAIKKIASSRLMRNDIFTSGHSHIGTSPQSPLPQDRITFALDGYSIVAPHSL